MRVCDGTNLAAAEKEHDEDRGHQRQLDECLPAPAVTLLTGVTLARARHHCSHVACAEAFRFMVPFELV